MIQPLLQLRSVSFRYEDMVMVFDLEVGKGEFVAVMGPSGSGKSTLLSLIAGFEAPLSGEILWEGKDITPLPPAERPLSILFQDNNLFAHLTVFTNVALGIDPSGKLGPQDRQRVMDGAFARRPSRTGAAPAGGALRRGAAKGGARPHARAAQAAAPAR